MAKVEWRSAPAQRKKYFDGPREVAMFRGGCTIEIFEACSNKRGTCPSGDYSYVVVKRGVVKAAGPHADSSSRQLTKDQAKRAGLRRAALDPKVKCG